MKKESKSKRESKRSLSQGKVKDHYLITEKY